MKDIQSDFNNSQEDIPTPQQMNIESTKELNLKDFSQKTTSIPFISKLSKEKKEELETKKKKVDHEKKNEIQDEDEIDRLISNISRNNVNKGACRGKIIVEDKAKLDFDQDVKVDINKIKSNRFVNFNNSGSANLINNDNTGHNNPISKYLNKTGQISLGDNNITNKNEYVEVKSNQNFEKTSSINTSSITNIPIKYQVPNQINLNLSIKSNSNSQVNSVPNPINVAKINYTQIKRIIDVTVVNIHSEISNSDLILCILELCINSVYYGFKYSNKSKIFWENLLKKNEYKNIFANFKPETLKKYWIILSEIKEFSKAVDLINKNKDLIDRKELK